MEESKDTTDITFIPLYRWLFSVSLPIMVFFVFLQSSLLHLNGSLETTTLISCLFEIYCSSLNSVVIFQTLFLFRCALSLGLDKKDSYFYSKEPAIKYTLCFTDNISGRTQGLPLDLWVFLLTDAHLINRKREGKMLKIYQNEVTKGTKEFNSFFAIFSI